VNASILTSPRFLVLAVAGLFVIGTYFHGFQTPERKVYALASKALPSGTVSSVVAVIAIDNAAIKGIGSWPWPRDRIAAVVDRLRRFGVHAIGITLALTEPQTPPALAGLVNDATKSGRKLSGILKKWATQLDSDGDLVRAIERQGRVVLAAGYTTNEPVPSDNTKGTNPGFAALKPVRLQRPDMLEFLLAPPATPNLVVRAPLTAFVDAAAGVGVTPDPLSHPAMPAIPLAVYKHDKAYPGFITLLSALTRRVPTGSLTVIPGNGVTIGKKTTVVAPDLRYWPLPPASEKDGERIPVISVAKLWEPDFSEGKLKNKTVLIGLTKPDLTPLVRVASDVELPPVVWAAYSLASLLKLSHVHRPVAFYGLQRAAIVLLAIVLLLMPWRWHGRTSLIVTGAVSLVMLNTELVVLITNQLWLPMVVPTLFLLTAQAILSTWRTSIIGAGTQLKELTEVCRDYARTLKNQGRLDDAFNQYRKSPWHKGLLEPLYELGLAYESRQQFPKAIAVFAYAAQIKPSFRDMRERLHRLKKIEAEFATKPLAGSARSDKTVRLNDSHIENPILGHYRLEREIGQGAMGIVYLATDEKLCRKVAVKALRLTDEFTGKALQEAQMRFQREAEAAARLSHPNNITIYETGADHDLEYIVMDFAEGESLESYTDPDELLSVWEVLEVGVQVAGALAYAHARQVIHRDVKPSNIIYDRQTGMVKVTDFGIACLIDSRRTRTGAILGTPSYMSPEQATGKRLDGRSDLFSLGVTMYQLLTGRLPFVGDSFANLIYQITTQRHPAIKKFSPGLNASISRIINRTLHKDPDQRYYDGSELSDALLRCQQKIKRTRKATRRT
jgi:CHASE2 domain-containing sensor protein/tRNA A-37 threonylcarbamoyl transferase component Bud32